MSTSGNEDQNQRNTPIMEDSPSMRIEFLRARLLSERSVSRTARQRADELAKRVAELEEQLKTVTLQRKKAEKATATVLAILENHGIGDASDGFDSGSDQDAALCESNVSDSSKDERKEASTERNLEVRDNDGETYSSSEIDSSSTGRSLSWKSDRESRHSSTRKKYMDSARRSSSFSSAGSSSKHVGKSCRRIRRRETRSAVEESYNDTARDNSGTTHTQGVPGSADFGTESQTDGLKHHAENGQMEFPAVQVLKNQKLADDSNLSCTLEGAENMEKALEHQAKLIGQFEAEERAQREWEEKYRENTSFIPDSGDLGNHSDVTEERYDMKPSEQTSSAKTQDLECKPERVDRHLSGAQGSPSDFQSTALGKLKCKKTDVSESSSPEFAFPVSKGQWDPVHSENNACRPHYTLHQSSPLSTISAKHASSSSDANNLQKGDTSGREYELALISHGTNKNVRSVLDALEQAKLSLRQKLNSSPQMEGGSSVKAAEPSIPVGCPALFRLPTDHWGYSSVPTQFSMVNHSPETVSDMPFQNHFLESRSMSMSTNSAVYPFSSISTNPSTQIGLRSAAWRPMFEPGVDSGLPPSSRLNFLDPQPSAGSPFPTNRTFQTYPFSAATQPQLSSSPGGFSDTLSGREHEMPPATRFSLYNDHMRPHMYR